ncbi:DNA polymerase I - 3'-5' exonuclease and polymerase domains [Pelotomaculum thermopropionicum SI]|uniref:DNA polymerase I n=1 Tax=Pelotomaculum thermopropionicum (strain DSM 13744 / JCM 10971 / SI) TaxID=370438 RepID=A5D075_PELTS|nr:DNA polymerase I - 3'-5' exonuclease and polymerase domains [Pelotomaculum thermopropionicum SI]
MELNFDGLMKTMEKAALSERGAAERVKEAQGKKARVKAATSWEDRWKQIFGMSKFKSGLDRQRAERVKAAVENGVLGMDVPPEKITGKLVSEKFRELELAEKNEKIAKLLKSKPDNYRLIQTEDQFKALLADLRHEPAFAFDTETTGVDVYQDVIVGVSLTLPRAGYHVYIPVAHNNAGPQLRRSYVLNGLKRYLTDPTVGKVLHNAKFDIHMLLRHGMRMRGLAHDTMIAMKILNENEPSVALKNLATRYGKFFGFDGESHTFEDLFGKACFADVPLDMALIYAAKDTHLTWELYKWQMEHLTKREDLLKLYRELENPLVDICVEMEQTGFAVDTAFAQEYGEELKGELAEVEKTLVAHFGEINFNSPAQLAEVLYDRLGLPQGKERSTDVKTLKGLKGRHPGIEPLLKYRELTKLLGTYVEALPHQLKADGRIHGSFNQVATVTGRFASREPNLQNLPPRARRLIVAPKGWLLLGIDFSQIEPRILAHMSGDPHFREPYLKGEDLYSTLAARVFKVPLSECGDGSKYRKMMKIGLLAVMYGTSMFTLSEQLGISVEEAHRFIEGFYDEYPDVYAFIKDTWEFVKKNEYVATLYGRKRRFPGHREQAIVYDQLAAKICKALGTERVPLDFWSNKGIPKDLKRKFGAVKGEVERVRRMAVNARIQGTAADIMKRALLNLYEYTRARGWKINGTVHDEALLLVRDTITLAEVEELEACMVRAAELEVPVKVDTEIMARWGDGVKKGEYKWVA